MREFFILFFFILIWYPYVHHNVRTSEDPISILMARFMCVSHLGFHYTISLNIIGVEPILTSLKTNGCDQQGLFRSMNTLIKKH